MKIKLSDIFYFIFGIYISTFLLSYTCVYLTSANLALFVKYTRDFCYLCFLAKIVLDLKFDQRIYIKIIFFLFLTLFVWLSSSHRDLILIGIVMLAYKNMNLKKLIKISYIVNVFLFMCIVSLSFFKIIPDWTYLRGDVVRHSLGFQYTTISIGCYLSIVLMFIYLKSSSIKIFQIIFLECINFVLYFYTNGRLSFLLITIILSIAFLVKFRFIKKIFASNFVRKTCSFLNYVLPISLFFIVIIVSKMYTPSNSFLNNLDNITSFRISLTHKALEAYEISLFGSNIEWIGYGGVGYVNKEYFVYNYVDTSYARILLDYGLIITLVILYLYTMLLRKKWQEKKYYEWFIICCVLVWGLLEPYLFNIGRNIFIIDFLEFFTRRRKGDDNIEKITES